MEILSRMSRECHRAAQEGRFPLIPRTREEVGACIVAAATASAALVGIPAVAALAKIGGLW